MDENSARELAFELSCLANDTIVEICDREGSPLRPRHSPPILPVQSSINLFKYADDERQKLINTPEEDEKFAEVSNCDSSLVYSLLSDAVIETIIRFLPWQRVLQFSSLNSQWRAISLRSDIWESLVKKTYHCSKTSDWRKFFVLRKQLEASHPLCYSNSPSLLPYLTISNLPNMKYVLMKLSTNHILAKETNNSILVYKLPAAIILVKCKSETEPIVTQFMSSHGF